MEAVSPDGYTYYYNTETGGGVFLFLNEWLLLFHVICGITSIFSLTLQSPAGRSLLTSPLMRCLDPALNPTKKERVQRIPWPLSQSLYQERRRVPTGPHHLKRLKPLRKPASSPKCQRSASGWVVQREGESLYRRTSPSSCYSSGFLIFVCRKGKQRRSHQKKRMKIKWVTTLLKMTIKRRQKLRRSKTQQLNRRKQKNRRHKGKRKPRGQKLPIHTESGSRSCKKRIRSKCNIFESLHSEILHVCRQLLKSFFFVSFILISVKMWICSCLKWREALPALQQSCPRSPSRSSKNASSLPSEKKAVRHRSEGTRHKMANRGASDRETKTTDPPNKATKTITSKSGCRRMRLLHSENFY